MRFSATTTASILFSLVALEALGAPAPQYDTTIIVSTTVDAAAGSAQVSDIPTSSAPASVATSAKACKAKTGSPPWAQAYGEHRRPRPSASASASGNPAPSQEVSSSGSDTTSSEVPEHSIIPITSVVETEPSPVESQMPSVVEIAPVVTPTAIEAGGDGEVEQSPPPQVAQSSAAESSFAFESSYSYESSSSSSWSSSAQPAPSASAGGAPAGDLADMLEAHNVFRATWGAAPLVWNQSLADMGNSYYKDKTCAMEHSGLPNGENLVGAALKGNAKEYVKMWTDESKFWPVGASDDPELKDENGKKIVVGHFTQVVWKNTTQLGCGTKDCGDQGLTFCEYFPAGNYKGEYGRSVGSPQ